MMVSMVPNAPRIRFKGFTEPWEKKFLGDFGKTYNGLSGKNKSDFGHGKGQYITYMNVFSNTIATQTGIDHIEIDDKQNKVQKGDILFTISSETPDEVGMSSVWLYDNPNIYLNSFCFGFRPTMTIDPYFSAYLMRSPNVRKAFYLLAQGISRFNISKQKAMDIEVFIPTINEQKRIGAFFYEQEEAINASQEKINKLRIIKQSLLQKMFAA